MSKVFCQCDKCNRDIFVGEVMVSLTMTRDKIIDESCLQPEFANALGMWCKSCASKELDKHTQEFKAQLNDDGTYLKNETEKMLKSEFSDFCSGFGNPGEPETAGDIVRELQKRMDVVCMAIFDMSTISAAVDEIKAGVENSEVGVFEKDLSEYSVGQKSVILAELSSDHYALCCGDLLVCNKN